MLQYTFELLLSSWIARDCLLVLALWLLWRLYAFTFVPYLYPNDPKPLPYWIPFLGHTVGFFRNSDRLIERGLNYFGRTHNVFSIQVVGMKLNIVTGHVDVSAAFRNNAVSFDGSLAQIFRSFGVTPSSSEKMWYRPQAGHCSHDLEINPNGICLAHLIEEIYRKQYLAGTRMNAFSSAALASVARDMKWDNFGSFIPSPRQKTPSQGSFSLKLLTARVIVQATTRAFFGEHLHHIEPDIVQHMTDFNENAWMVVFRYPDWFNLPVTSPKNNAKAALKKFLQLPKDQRQGESWALGALVESMNLFQLDMDSQVAIVLLGYWA